MTRQTRILNPAAPDRPPPSALDTGSRIVPDDWIDYNGHMMDGYYSLAFTEATNGLLDHLDLGADYRKRTGCSIYTVESHVCFLASARGGDRLRYTSQLLAYDAKRLHVFHRITLPAGEEAATNELMFLHVDLAAERVTPMPRDRFSAVAALAFRHAALPVPELAGHQIAMPARV